MSELLNPMCLEGCRKLATEKLFYAASDSPMIVYVIGVLGAAILAHLLVKLVF